MRKSSCVLLVLAAILCLGLADKTILKPSEEIEEILETSRQKEYSLVFSDVLTLRRLFIRLEGEASDAFGLPLLTVDYGSNRYSCPACSDSNSMRLCQLPTKIIDVNTTIKITVGCVQHCSYRLKAWVADQLQIYLGKGAPIELSESLDTFEGKLLIPANADFTQIKIIATVGNDQQIEGLVELFANVGDNPGQPTKQKYDVKGQPIWNEGSGLFFSKPQVMPNQTVRFVLTGTRGLSICLSSYQSINRQREISVNELIEDDVTQNTTKIYRLILNSQLLPLDATLNVKVVRYAGQTRVLVSPDTSFRPEKVISGMVTHFVNSIEVTPKARKQLGFGDTFYVAVSGDRDSTFILICTVNVDDFTILDDFSNEFSEVEGTDVDNYMYGLTEYSTEDGVPNIQTFGMGLEVFSERVGFGIRRCPAMEDNWAHSELCVFKNSSQISQYTKDFSKIAGKLEDRGSVVHFTFDYDISTCSTPIHGVLKCVFQIVVFSKESSTNPARYSLRFERGSRETVLSEGTTTRDFADSNDTNFYWFALTDLSSVKEVKFALTVLSGDCQLFISNDQRHVNLTDKEVTVAKDNHISFTTSELHNYYYPAVHCYDESFYSISVSVDRVPIESYQEYENAVPFLLLEGVPQSFKFGINQTEQSFYLTLSRPLEAFVQLTVEKGEAKLQVRTSVGFDTTNGTLWQGDSLVRLHNSKGTYTRLNEFVAKVVGKPGTSFQLQFSTESNCKQQNLNDPLALHFLQDEKTCLRFKVRKLASLEIVLSYNGLDNTLGKMNMLIRWQNKTSEESRQRITTYTEKDLKALCPNLQLSAQAAASNTTECILELSIEASDEVDARLVVQHTNDEVALLDGIEQPVHGYLSITQAKHFWWEVAPAFQPIFISLKSESDTDYTLLASFVDARKFYTVTGTELYPKPNDQNVLKTQSGHFRSASLQIRSAALEGKHGQILLISVYSKLAFERPCSFRIELLQGISHLSQSETKLGYIEEGDRQQYTIQPDSTQSMLVHINSYGSYCFTLDVFDQHGKALLENGIQEEFVIGSDNNSTSYLVQLSGVSSCPFEIGYAPLKRKLFELVLGRPFKFELAMGQKFYFLYYNADADPFRVVPMTDYGMVDLRLRQLSSGTVADLDNYLSTLDDVWDNSNLASQTAVVANMKRPSCNGCYFLIQASSAESAASVRLVLHGLYSPLMIKSHKIIRQALDMYTPSMTYALYERSSHNVSIELFYGQLQIDATHTVNESFKFQQTINSSFTFELVYTKKPVEIKTAEEARSQISRNNGLLEGQAFIIRVSCKDRCGYSLVAQTGAGYAYQTTDGLPKSMVINSSSKPTCSQFLSLEREQNIQLHIFVQNTSLLNYHVKLLKRETWSAVAGQFILSEDKSERQINLELKSATGYYLICMTLIDQKQPPLNISLMHTSQHRPIIATKLSQYLLNVPQSLTFEMYNPTNRSVMIEVFQCRGKVQLLATTDYLSLLRNSSQLAEHTKTAGHYIMQLEQTEDNGNMFFARVDPHESKASGDQNTSITYRYSTFHEHYFPYRCIGANDYSIRYHSSQGTIQITLQAVSATRYYRLASADYRLYAARKQDEVKAAVQCNTGSLLTKSRALSINDIESVEEITFEINVRELVDLLPAENSYVYVGVNCAVTALEPQSTDQIELKFVYQELQMTVVDIPIGRLYGFKSFSKVLFLWVLLPLVLIMLVLRQTILYCCRWFEAFQRERFLLESEEDPKQSMEPGASVTQTVTMKNLVLPDNDQSRPYEP